MSKIILAVILVLCAMPVSHAAAVEDSDTINIFGPPRARVRALVSKVSRTKRPAPLIVWHGSWGFIQEATRADFMRWLSRDPLTAVGQTPTAAPAGRGDKEYRQNDIVVQ